ncbi:MAG: alpha/beta hydrolase [Lachnospiraceae bacterium]|nr:alpha/beta hydrolase [Lachnospiraceae bacterium]
MTIHEFGSENERVVLLIHPSLVMWDYYEYVIPLLQDRYHLVIPALPGYDEDGPGDFTSVEEIAAELAGWLAAHGHAGIDCAYGCSMGGSVVARMLADGRVRIRSAIIDGGITPYQLPWVLTRLIAVRDFLMIYLGKLAGPRLIEKAFTSDEYSEEDLKYVEKVLKFISARTIWRTFDSCNNYEMPEEIRTDCPWIEYWYARTEEKARRWDIRYIRKHFPGAVFRVFEDFGHGGLAVLKPELLASEIERVTGG